MDLTIQSEASLLSFDFRFIQPGDGDSLRVSFNDMILFDLSGENISGSDFQSVAIPIRSLAGKTGVLTVKLINTGAPNAEFEVSNFQILSSNESSPTLPDLVVSNLGNPPASVVAGGMFTMPSTTTNQGTGSAGQFSTVHYLSLDNTITNADLAVPGTYSFGGLAAGNSESLTVTITVPTSVASGTYFFGACADALSEVAEFNETNNCRVATTTLVVNPACANVVAPVSVTRGGFRQNSATGRYVQQVTLKNTGSSAIAGLVSLVLDNLSSNATLFNKNGVTSCATPTGSPVVNVNVSMDSVLSAGESASVVLEFTNPNNQLITYTTRVVAGSGTR